MEVLEDTDVLLAAFGTAPDVAMDEDTAAGIWLLAEPGRGVVASAIDVAPEAEGTLEIGVESGMRAAGDDME